MLTRTTTADGLCILVEPLPHTYSVALGCFVGVGARYEPPDQSGLSHFVEHVAFKGTRSLPTARQLAYVVEGLGGYLDAATSYETTSYWARVAHIHFDQALHVLTDLVRYPLFEADELQKERRVVLEELRGLQDTPSEWVHTLVQESLWGAQPLGRDIAGTLESVAGFHRQQVLHFWQQHYLPARMVVSVAGNVQPEQVIAAITDCMAVPAAPAPDLPAPLAFPTQPAQPGPRLALQRREADQGHFCLGFEALSYNDPDRWALDVFDTVMGGGMSSRLFQELREERGLAYDVGCYYNKYADSGIWVVYGSVEPATLNETVRVVFTMLHALLREGVDAAELRHVKEQIKGGLLLSLEDTWAIASRNGTLQLRYGSVSTPEEALAQIEAVSSDDVLRVARRVVQPQGMHLAVIGPYQQRERETLHTLLEDFRL